VPLVAVVQARAEVAAAVAEAIRLDAADQPVGVARPGRVAAEALAQLPQFAETR